MGDVGDEAASRSRRAKPAADEARPGPRRRSHVWVYGVALLLVVGIFVLKNLDGGPDTSYQGARATQMALVEWNHAAVDPATDTVLLRCGSASPCDGAALAEAAERGADCSIEATYWLVSARAPIVSFDVGGEANLRSLKIDVAGIRDNGTGVEFMDDNQTLPWDGGAWWKAESEHVTVQAEVLCDLDQFAATFQLEGRAWYGERWSMQQRHSILVQPPDLPSE